VLRLEAPLDSRDLLLENHEECRKRTSLEQSCCYHPGVIEPSIALYGEAFSKVNESLDGLLSRAHARYAMMVDRKGFVLAHREALWAPKPPALDSIATLIAGNAAATGALAKLLGEQNFNELVQQGDRIGLYIVEVNKEAFIGIVFDETSQLGKVKLFAKKAIEEIRDLIENMEPMEQPTMDFGNDFTSSANSLLDDLFGGG
jgi:predicted regulator of Ras-like GTPase activity (Roadblock/LC7/MglB family)